MRSTSTRVLVATALLLAATTANAQSRDGRYNGRTRPIDGRVRLIDNYPTAAIVRGACK
jgi:hypothetical protein